MVLMGAATAFAQLQSQECASLADPGVAASPKTPSGTVPAQIQPRRPAPARSTFGCRCGAVDASTLTAKANSQEVPVLTGLSGSFRFDHVLLRETVQFASATPGTVSVSSGTAGNGKDVTSAFALRNPAAPDSLSYERPGPPRLTGAYDLVLLFQASFALGDGNASNFNGGTVTWEVCGFNGPPAKDR